MPRQSPIVAVASSGRGEGGGEGRGGNGNGVEVVIYVPLPFRNRPRGQPTRLFSDEPAGGYREPKGPSDAIEHKYAVAGPPERAHRERVPEDPSHAVDHNAGEDGDGEYESEEDGCEIGQKERSVEGGHIGDDGGDDYLGARDPVGQPEVRESKEGGDEDERPHEELGHAHLGSRASLVHVVTRLPDRVIRVWHVQLSPSPGTRGVSGRGRLVGFLLLLLLLTPPAVLGRRHVVLLREIVLALVEDGTESVPVGVLGSELRMLEVLVRDKLVRLEVRHGLTKARDDSFVCSGHVGRCAVTFDKIETTCRCTGCRWVTRGGEQDVGHVGPREIVLVEY